MRLLVCKLCVVMGGVLFLGMNTTLAAVSAKDVALKAIESNPDIQARWYAFQSSGFDVKEARSSYLPSIDLSARTGKQKRDYDDRGNYDVNQLEISLTQMLFDGFRTRHDVARLNSARQVRFFELLGTIDDTTLEVMKAVEDVLRYRELLELAQKNYQKHLVVEKQIADRVHQGVARRTDLDQVSGRVALAESNILTESANLHDVTARYLRIVGDFPAEDLLSPVLRYPVLLNTVPDVLYAAYQGNASFHASIKNIASIQSSVKKEKSGYFPRLELRARHGTQQNVGVFDDRTDPDDFGDDSAIELALTYNLYKGGANRAAVRRSLSEVSKAKSERDQVCVNLRQTVQISHNDTKRIAEQLVSLQQHRDSINKVRKAYAEQFKIGQRTLLDVLDAENEYFQASRSRVNAEHDLTLAHTRLLAATGELLPALSIVRENLGLLKGVDDDLDSINVDPSAACPAVAPSTKTRQELISAEITLESDLLFAKGRSKLLPQAAAHLNTFLNELKADNRRVKVAISAYTDNTGIDAINIPLSKARAEAVRNYLVINGLKADMVQMGGYGSMRPVASNTTEAGRSANRRIEITVSQLSS